MSTRLWRTAPLGLAVALVPLIAADAHEIVGNRLFPATLNVDDPGVNDELAVPTVSIFKNGDDPSARQWASTPSGSPTLSRSRSGAPGRV
jgi:hypothetical protein